MCIRIDIGTTESGAAVVDILSKQCGRIGSQESVHRCWLGISMTKIPSRIQSLLLLFTLTHFPFGFMQGVLREFDMYNNFFNLIFFSLD